MTVCIEKKTQVKPVHNSKEEDELHSLLAMLEHSGPCAMDRGEGIEMSCIYVKKGHEGCAIGRRMTEREKENIVAMGANHHCIESLAGNGYLPEYFNDWDKTTLNLLQHVHDTYPDRPDRMPVHDRHLRMHRNAIKDYYEHIAETA
mgnify:FL=1